MPADKTSTFTSLSDFKSKFYSLFRGPTFYSTFTKLDKKLRKKIMITVSIANNCME
jgi:precorrin-2 methylase